MTKRTVPSDQENRPQVRVRAADLAAHFRIEQMTGRKLRKIIARRKGGILTQDDGRRSERPAVVERH